MVNVLKFQIFSFRLLFRAGIHKMLVRITNREEPDQTYLGRSCLYRPFFGRVVFEILENLPKSHFIIHSITSNMETIENTMRFFLLQN